MRSTPPPITDLRHAPHFAPTLADRVWRAWWEPKGVPLSFIETLVQQNLTAEPIPFALVAHEGETFFGTASVIASDCEQRPEYTPWVAAVWVEPEHRGKGIGSALVRAAAGQAHALGFDPVHLCALPPMHGFYERLGFRLLEEGVTASGLAVFRSR
jgi:GNAT superfamily N-acetyltransferase